MDVLCQGGYPTGRRLFPEIARQGQRFAFHSWGTALEVVAAAHWASAGRRSSSNGSSIPATRLRNRPACNPFPLASEILKEPLQIDHGDLIVPNKPGLEWTSMKASSNATLDSWPWSYFTMTSPKQTWASRRTTA